MRTFKYRKLIVTMLFIVLLTPAVSFGLDVGDKAPVFTGNSTQGKVASGDFLGKKNVVLALYFAVFTRV